MPALAAPYVGKQQLLCVSGNGCPKLRSWVGEFGDGFDVHGIVGLAVCWQSSQGRTLQPQCGATTAGPVMTPTVCSIGAIPVSVDRRVVPPAEPSVAAFTSGFHRRNGVTSATSMMYQIFFAASQRAPSALASSFSANGTFKLILMGELSAPCTGFTAFATFGLIGCANCQPTGAAQAQCTAPLLVYQPSTWTCTMDSILLRRIFIVGVRQPFSMVQGSGAMTIICKFS